MNEFNIKLRELSVLDLPLLVKIETNPDNLVFSGLTEVPSIDDLIELINEEASIFSSKQKRFTIEYKNSAVGFADLFEANFNTLTANVGIIVLPEYRKLQIGTASIRMLCDAARTYGIKTLIAQCKCDNKPSILLFQKANFSIVSQTNQTVNLQLQLDA